MKKTVPSIASRPKKKIGRPKRRPSVDEHGGMFLTYSQLGASLGQSYKQTRALIEQNHIPTAKSGVKTTIHIEVARAVVDGSWWLQKKGEVKDVGSIAEAQGGEIRGRSAGNWGQAARQALAAR